MAFKSWVKSGMRTLVGRFFKPSWSIGRFAKPSYRQCSSRRRRAAEFLQALEPLLPGLVVQVRDRAAGILLRNGEDLDPEAQVFRRSAHRLRDIEQPLLLAVSPWVRKAYMEL